MLSSLQNIWRRRNQTIFANDKPDSRKDVGAINKAYEEHLTVWFARSHDLVSKWIPPPTSWFSIKFDAAIRPHSTFTTAVVRNESGEVFLALHIFSLHLIRPKHKQQFRQSNWLFSISFPLFSLKETLTVSLRLQDLPSSPP